MKADAQFGQCSMHLMHDPLIKKNGGLDAQQKHDEYYGWISDHKIYGRIGDVNNVDDAEVRTNGINTIDEGNLSFIFQTSSALQRTHRGHDGS